MGRTTVVLLAVFLTAGAVFAQEPSSERITGLLEISGEIRTGLYMEQEKIGKLEPVAMGGMTNNDGHSGGSGGVLHMDFRYTYGNMGLRTRFQIEPGVIAGPVRPTWSFAYAWGNLFDNQLTISAGLLAESPWGTGGPELNREPETREYMAENILSRDIYTKTEGLLGIRFEYKPSFVPGLNIGFVVNQPDQTIRNDLNQNFADALGESVVGVAYEHEYFAARVGYRFDSNADYYSGSKMNEGGRLTYRLEERVLETLAPGMRVWLNGVYYGIGCEQFNDDRVIGWDETDPNNPVQITEKVTFGSGEYFINWLYWLWDTNFFIAGFDTCFSVYKTYINDLFFPTTRQKYQSLEFKPVFYYKFFNNLLQAGLGLGFGMEFGPGRTYINAPYQYFSVEPQAKLNIGGNAYIALVYNFTGKYAWWRSGAGFDVAGVQVGDKSQKHSINLRAVYTF